MSTSCFSEPGLTYKFQNKAKKVAGRKHRMLWFSLSWQQRTTQSLSLLTSSHQNGEKNQKENAKLVGWDKNSLREWQREKKITTIILVK